MTTYKSKLPEISLKYKTGEIYKTKIQSSTDLFNVMYKMFNSDTIEYSEEVIVLFLNNANNTIGWMKHSSGGTCHTIVDIKIILATALQCGASCVTLAHNHPSGQTFPSREDDKVTARLKAGCEAIGIRLLDHIIVCSESTYYSYCDDAKI
ncbi:MAG: JAB domain-containing protein [Paludibacter sp.]|nr:JAB domain-containing protein [Paludibacter sp.]